FLTGLGSIRGLKSLLVITPGSKEFHQLEWIIGLNPRDTLIDGILPLLFIVPIYKDAGVGLLSRGYSRRVKIPLVETEHLGMKQLHEAAHVLRVEGFRHEDTIRPEFRNLLQIIRTLGPEHHMGSHVVPIDGGHKIVRSSHLGVNVYPDFSFRKRE